MQLLMIHACKVFQGQEWAFFFFILFLLRQRIPDDNTSLGQWRVERAEQMLWDWRAAVGGRSKGGACRAIQTIVGFQGLLV